MTFRAVLAIALYFIVDISKSLHKYSGMIMNVQMCSIEYDIKSYKICFICLLINELFHLLEHVAVVINFCIKFKSELYG